MEDRILQLEMSNVRLQALELKVQQQVSLSSQSTLHKNKQNYIFLLLQFFFNQDKVQEALTTKVIELEAKVQQQQFLLDVLKNKQPQLKNQSVINNDKSRAVSQMPASCSDLQMMGHYLNGFYSVMGVGKMDSVYCDFTKPPSESGTKLQI